MERENRSARETAVGWLNPQACSLGSPSSVRRSELSHLRFPGRDRRRRSMLADVSVSVHWSQL